MKDIPTLTDLFHNHWGEEWDHFRQTMYSFNWYWGEHLVLQILLNEDSEKTYTRWQCPQCGTSIALIHTPDSFHHRDGRPISGSIPLRCAVCEMGLMKYHYKTALEYDNIYKRIQILCHQINNKFGIFEEYEIETMELEITKKLQRARQIEEENGWNH